MPISPSTVLAMMLDDLPDQTTRSAETTSTCMGSAIPLQSAGHSILRRAYSLFLLQLRPAALDVLHAAHVEERLFGNVINFAVTHHSERLDGVVERHGRPWNL